MGTSRLDPSRLLGLVGHRDNDSELLWGAFRLSCCYEARLRRDQLQATADAHMHSFNGC